MRAGDEEYEKRLRNSYVMLWLAVIGGCVAAFALMTNHTGPFLAFWALAFLGGLGGVRDAARTTGVPAALMYPALVLIFIPAVNVLVAGLFLMRVHKALNTPPEVEEEPAPRVPASRAHAKPGAQRPPGATPARAAHRIRGAIACVKSASLGVPGTAPIPDGTKLQVNMPSAQGDISPADLPVMRATHGCFAVCYLVDEGAGFSYVNDGQLQEAGLSLEELHKVAVANLAALIGGKPGLSVHPQPGFHGLAMGGQFEASLVLVDALWDRALAEHFPNGPVVALPARDVCAFCDAHSQEGLAQLRATVARVTAGGDHLLSDRLFVRNGGRWRQLAPG